VYSCYSVLWGNMGQTRPRRNLTYPKTHNTAANLCEQITATVFGILNEPQKRPMWRPCPSAPLAFSLLPSISDQTVCRRFTNSVLWCSLREVVQTFMTSGQWRLYFSRDVNEFLSVLTTFIIHMGEIRNNGYAHNTVQELWILEKSAQERLYFSYERKWNYSLRVPYKRTIFWK